MSLITVQATLHTFCVHTCLLLVSVLVLFFVNTQVTHAALTSAVPLSGYAWSDNIGWISLNCETGGTTGGDICSTVSYGVEINTDMTLSGYAWSDNIGWIKFGGLSSIPAGGQNAQITGSNLAGWSMSGWIRACAGTLTGDCSSMANHVDGWDGWISLNCTNISGSCTSTNYGVTVNNGSFGGYAWGSDVVGWVSFQFAAFSTPCTEGNTCTADFLGTTYTNMWCDVDPVYMCTLGQVCSTNTNVCSTIVINGTLDAAPLVIRKKSTSALTWGVTNPAEVDTCHVEGSDGSTLVGTSGTLVATNAITFAQVVYTLSCTPAGGGPFIEVASTTVKTLPNIFET